MINMKDKYMHKQSLIYINIKFICESVRFRFTCESAQFKFTCESVRFKFICKSEQKLYKKQKNKKNRKKLKKFQYKLDRKLRILVFLEFFFDKK